MNSWCEPSTGPFVHMFFFVQVHEWPRMTKMLSVIKSRFISYLPTTTSFHQTLKHNFLTWERLLNWKIMDHYLCVGLLVIQTCQKNDISFDPSFHSNSHFSSINGVNSSTNVLLDSFFPAEGFWIEIYWFSFKQRNFNDRPEIPKKATIVTLSLFNVIIF